MAMFSLSALKDTFIKSKSQHQTQCHSAYLPVGKIGLDYIFSYIFFDLSSIPDDHIISSAELKVFFYNPSYEGQPPRFIGLQALAESFWDCFTNYGNRPATIPETLIKIPIPVEYVYISINVTELVKAWHSGTIINNGIALIPLDFNKNGVLLFHSSDNPHSSYRPLLLITTTPSEKPRTENFEEICNVSNQEGFSKFYEIWRYTIYSFIIKNIGLTNIKVNIQCSPDGIETVCEPPELVLVPGQSSVLVSNYFTRYARVRFRLDSDENDIGKTKIWLQARV